MPPKKKAPKPKAKAEPKKPREAKKFQGSTRALVKTDQSPARAIFPIIGIGCSAGGLDALKQLFEAMPENTGMGFVIVSHLDPNYVSLLPNLLKKQTQMEIPPRKGRYGGGKPTERRLSV